MSGIYFDRTVHDVCPMRLEPALLQTGASDSAFFRQDHEQSTPADQPPASDPNTLNGGSVAVHVAVNLIGVKLATAAAKWACGDGCGLLAAMAAGAGSEFAAQHLLGEEIDGPKIGSMAMCSFGIEAFRLGAKPTFSPLHLVPWATCYYVSSFAALFHD